MQLIKKPWGEEAWLELNDKYCYKRILIRAGHRTSLQYHRKKLETNYIVEGQAEVWLEDEQGVLAKRIEGSGTFFTVAPLRKHRIVALTDLVLLEVSTPEVDDVVRIADDTNRGDGRIESEHVGTKSAGSPR
ncbi:cupin [Archangium sp.]|uniref:cupin n=1 Tax=Archangium sp. TaxID=1872627 RepID=UPI002D27F6DD|nr:cupin [Archangium sp.]HYO56179.1 cupin [Archangium sp.]